MHYYLPINIDGRRLHCFDLKDTEVEKPEPQFSFIVKVRDNVSLLSIDSDDPQLISSEGSNNNKSLSQHRFRVEKAERIGDYPSYRIVIEVGKAVPDVNDHTMLKAYGYMGAEDMNHSAVVKLDPTRATDDNRNLVEPIFNVIISYKADNKKVYEEAVRFYLYTEDQQLASAALDFGSEASQIRFGGTDSNDTVIDTLLSLSNQSPQTADEYWQGKPGDALYKSVFFINMRPGATEYAKKPTVGEKTSFVLPLLPSTTPKNEYSNLELLPNLKLIEIGMGRVGFTGRRIEFQPGSTIEYGNAPSLSSQVLRDSILRIILSNFLHCILKNIGNNTDKYLRMVLMVPNVYYQSKIYALMRDLYKDYSTIQASEESYPHCKGFEVQVVSESDAAFLGVKHRRKDIKNAKNGYFLIIDAGKGTTDFSILQQHDDFSKFSSLYRDGIPASGNVLTYAFHEALHSFMSKHNIPLNEMLEKAEKSELLQYMNNLEQFKKDYGKSSVLCEEPKAQNISSMANIISYLKEESKNRRQIPECEAYIKRKVGILSESLELSLKNYLENSNIQFLQVLLTGRGFLFEPFKTAVINMLERNKWIANDKSVIRINGDEAKTICLSGALAIEKECSVNCNSGLIGSPIIRQATDNRNWFAIFISNLLKKRAKAKEVDLDFFYQGSNHISAQNVTVIIGGREYLIASPNREDKALFYTGEGFICQKEDSCEEIDEHNFTFSDETIGGLVLESLFPFYPGSIQKDSDMIPINGKQPDPVPQSTQQQPDETIPDEPEDVSINTSEDIVDVDS